MAIEFTPTFAEHVSPWRRGVYQVFPRYTQLCVYAYWNGKRWSYHYVDMRAAATVGRASIRLNYHGELAWRGITKQAYEELNHAT
jgi:hypothetical protein